MNLLAWLAKFFARNSKGVQKPIPQKFLPFKAEPPSRSPEVAQLLKQPSGTVKPLQLIKSPLKTSQPPSLPKTAQLLKQSGPGPNAVQLIKQPSGPKTTQLLKQPTKQFEPSKLEPSIFSTNPPFSSLSLLKSAAPAPSLKSSPVPATAKESIRAKEAVSAKDYGSFRNALGSRESSDRYAIVNAQGYLGRYQFGTARLTDLGLCKRKEGTTGESNSDFEWAAPFTADAFLKSPALQDACFDVHAWHLKNWIESNYQPFIGKEVNGVLFTLSGGVACCHLVGPRGLKLFFKGIIKADRNGIKSTDYIKQFSGYTLLKTTPRGDVAYFKSLLS
jgi:hypothetical protein